MSEPDLESLQQTSEQLSRIYREAADELPPQERDDTILAASRRAVGSRPRLATSPFSSTWAIPLSLAAVLVLSVTVTFMMTEHKSPMDYLPAEAPEVTTPKAPETPAPSSRANEAPPPGVESSALPQEQLGTRRQNRPEPLPLNEDTKDVGLQESLSGKLRKDVPAKADSLLRDDSVMDKTQPARAFPGRQSQPEAEEAPAAASGNVAPTPTEKESDLREEQKQAAPSLLHKMERAKTEADEAENLTPQAWLEYIMKLRSEGRLQEAEDSLARFKVRYPNYALPDELQ